MPSSSDRRKPAHAFRSFPSRRSIGKLLRAGLVSGALSATVGCNLVNESVGSSVSPGLPTNRESQDAEIYQRYFAPEKIDQCLGLPRNSAQRQSCRDLITYARIRYIDINYESFRRRAFLEVSGGNAAADITVLGLGAAGALVPGATTKSILAAISAGIVGAKGIIDKDVLYNSGIQTLILKMDADRAAVRRRITDNLKQNELVYPFEAAELDAGDYFRVGTLSNALITLQGDAAATLSVENRWINTQTPAVPVWSRPSPEIALGSAPMPPPAAVPPAPASPPLAAVPPSTPPAPPVPSPRPGVPDERTTFTPSGPARSKLFRALLSDARGNRPFDPTRIQLMHQCWNELINPPPDNFANWILQAPDRTLTAVADCVNRKAAPALPRGLGVSTPFGPTTPARSQVFLALKSDAQGARPFDAARIQLLHQCWNELISPPPDNFTTWVLQATDQTLSAVASCISSKAGGGAL